MNILDFPRFPIYSNLCFYSFYCCCRCVCHRCHSCNFHALRSIWKRIKITLLLKWLWSTFRKPPLIKWQVHFTTIHFKATFDKRDCQRNLKWPSIKIVNKISQRSLRTNERSIRGKIGTLWRHIPIPMNGAESAVSGYGRCDVGMVQDSKSYDYLTLIQYPCPPCKVGNYQLKTVPLKPESDK